MLGEQLWGGGGGGKRREASFEKGKAAFNSSGRVAASERKGNQPIVRLEEEKRGDLISSLKKERYGDGRFYRRR